MATGVVTWSQTANTNANIDTNLNWAEGMAPSAVNDQVRALMTSVAKYRDDKNGSIVTAGGSTSYTLSTNQVFGALTGDYDVWFCPHTTNGNTVVLNVDGLGAKPLRTAPNTELPAGVLVQGTPYGATYKTTNSGEWILKSFYSSPFAVPVGAMMPFMGTTAPNANFALPFGQSLSRATYATLFSLCSTNHGSGIGDGLTFSLIDLRGRLPIGWDLMGGTSTGRITNAVSGFDPTVVGAAGGVESVALTTAQLASHNHAITDSTHTHTVPSGGGSFGVSLGAGGNAAQAGTSQTTGASATGISVNSTGSGTGHPNVQPAVVCPWIIRIL